MLQLASLKEILEKELALIDELIGQEEKMQKLLIRGDAPEVEKLNAVREQKIVELEGLEEERCFLIPQGKSLKGLLEEEEGAEKDELKNLGKKMFQRYTVLKRIQELNQHLLKHNINFSRQMRETLFPQTADDSYYPSKRKVKTSYPASAGLLDINA